MSKHDFVPPEDYLRVLQELSDEEKLPGPSNASDVDESESMGFSDHNTDSEIDADDPELPSKKLKGRCAECGRMKNNYTTVMCSQCARFTCKNHLGKTTHVCIACCNKPAETAESD